jgi:hypothetical protein
VDITDYAPPEIATHERMLREAAAGIKDMLHKSWKEQGRVQPFVISWIQEPIICDDGTTVTNHFWGPMPEDRSKWTTRLATVIEKTKPFALMLCEQRRDEVVVIFESREGTRSWRYPIKMHGHNPVLGDPTTRDDVDSLGVLWRAKKARA